MNTQPPLVTMVETPKALILQITATGKLQHSDYQRINNALDNALKAAPKSDINVYFDMTQMQGFTLHAAWDDLVLGIKHWSHFKKVAIIGDQQWQKTTVNIAAQLSHIDYRIFSNPTTASLWLAE